MDTLTVLWGLDEDWFKTCSGVRVKVNSLPEVNITTIEELNRGTRTKGGIVCRDYFEEKWMEIHENDPRICDRINDCLSDLPVSLDEENCDILPIKVRHFNLENSILRACGTYPGGQNQSETDNYNQCRENLTFSLAPRHFNLTSTERNGKGSFREEGVVCKDVFGSWILIGFSEPERCDGLFLCESGLDEANCTDLLGKVPILIALGIFVVCLLAHMLRVAHYQYMGISTEYFGKQFSKK